MFYLTRMLRRPVVDSTGEEIGAIRDIAIATGEIFPRVTSLAFMGPEKTPFMLSWRKYVEGFDGERVKLNAPREALRFSYLQPDEVLLARDLLDKQIVDTQGMKVVRVNDLKLSESRNQLRLLGAEVGLRGILRGVSPAIENAVAAVTRTLGRELRENLIAWNYMDLLDRDLSHVKLSVTHKRLHELHPADVADILEKLGPSQRAKVFEHLDNAQTAEVISELEDEFQADVIDDLTQQRASDILEMMDPDDAADIIGDLPYDKAEALLRLMGLKESRQIRKLLGYKEKTAGGIMTPEVTTVTEEMTVQEVIDHLRAEGGGAESIYYIYVVEDDGTLGGVVSLRDLIMSGPDTPISDIVERDVIRVDADDDQEDVADTMSKYDLLAVPVVDESGHILGIVTVDDALDVMEEESAEDLALAGGIAPFGLRPGGMTEWSLGQARWMVVWGSLLIVGAFLIRPPVEVAERDPIGLAALLFLPLVIRLTEQITAYALGQLIQEVPEEERPTASRRLLVGGASGLGLGLGLALLVFAFMEILSAQPVASAIVAIPAALTVLVMSLAGVVVTLIGQSREHSPLFPQVARVAMTLGSALLYLALTYATLVAGVLALMAANPIGD